MTIEKLTVPAAPPSGTIINDSCHAVRFSVAGGAGSSLVTPMVIVPPVAPGSKPVLLPETETLAAKELSVRTMDASAKMSGLLFMKKATRDHSRDACIINSTQYAKRNLRKLF